MLHRNKPPMASFLSGIRFPASGTRFDQPRQVVGGNIIRLIGR
jgi:hypothetical protein